MKGTGLIVLLLGLACSCGQGGSRQGALTPVSDLDVECMGTNRLPLECLSLTRDEGELTLRYQFHAEDCLCTSYPVLVCPDPGRWTVTVNGMKMNPLKGKPGAAEERYNIDAVVHEGENTVELHGTGSVVPVSLTGDFSVRPLQPSGWSLSSGSKLRLGSLSSQGLPFYQGTVSYRREYEAAEKVGKRILRLSGWKGGSCELWVNEEKVADVTTDLFEMNIGPFFREGLNGVEIRITRPGQAPDRCSVPAEFGLFQDFTIE